MQSKIIRGDIKSKNLYVEKFVDDKKIAPYNILTFDEQLKIAEVREIRKALSTAMPSGTLRLFVIKKSPTDEAQNALLKTLEELSDETEFIFFDDGKLLPTIISRCFIVNLESGSQDLSFSGRELIEELVIKTPTSEKLLLLDTFFKTERENPTGEIISILRNIILDQIKKRIDFEKSYYYLKRFVKRGYLTDSNNLNHRLFAERVFLS